PRPGPYWRLGRMVESTTASTGDPGGGAVTTNAVATPVRGSSARAWPDDQLGEIFADDQLSLRHAVIGMIAAVAGGAAAALAAWFVLRGMSLPAFGGSFVTRAASSAATVVLLAVVSALLFVWAMRGAGNRPKWLELLTYAVAYLAPAGLV